MNIRKLGAQTAFVALIIAPSIAESQTRTAAPARSGSPAAPQEKRDDWQRVPDIFAALGAGNGSRLADLGAGEGWLTTRLARLVGPSGRVFAADISASALDRLSETLAKDSLRNVELVLSEDDDPRLPYGTLDGVVIVNAYHEMTKRVAVLEGIKRALKPGGRLVILDSPPADTAFRTRQQQTSHHALDLAFARDDLEAHGFEIVSAAEDFVSSKHENHDHRQWMLVARKATK